ncbi:TPA: capsular biosynthesis protein [Campylobacter jejuni]|nr:capsular biosynthesis protein [Campylobacter jejuni]HDZ5084320.1 capsular biosynthesis protein [Campylobacter jejuni]
MKILSIVIPFGLSKERSYIQERVLQKIKEFEAFREEIDFIFVEGYSSVFIDLKKEIENSGYLYIKDTIQQDEGFFSAAKCRNLGARHVKTRCLTFLDVDLKLDLKKLLRLILVKQIDQNPAAFLVLPCIYLNQEASLAFLENNLSEYEILQDLIYDKKEYVYFLMKASSVVVFNTYTFLQLGGYRNFVGFGSEDFDLLARLLKFSAQFEVEAKELTYFSKSWNFEEFKGFRSLFSMLGLEAMFYGLYTFHMWHEKLNQNNYLDNLDKNHQIFLNNLLKETQEDALILANAKEKICILHPENSYPYNTLQKICVFLGEFMAASEGMFFDEDIFNEQRFLSFIQKHKITRFIFSNPYARVHIQKLYEYMRAKQIPFLCFERGAFPDTWFFDDSGFLTDSINYQEQIWNKVLSKEEEQRTKTYIDKLLNADQFLENNNQKIQTNELRKRLGVRDKKVIFVPLQVVGDTAVRFFTYEPFTYENFLVILDELALKYSKEELVFVCKNHPLSFNIDKTKYKNLIFAPNDTNFLSLLELSFACITLNSGVGMYAMILKKPCILCAKAFYAFENLNLQAHSKEELESHINHILRGNFFFDESKMLRFIKYLRKDYYSYAKSQSKVLQGEISFFRRTTHLYWYQIILGKDKVLKAKFFEKQSYKLNSLHYLPFVYEIKKNRASFDKKTNKVLNYLKVQVTKETKIYRLFRKFLRDPKAFFIDSKNPLFYPIKKFLIAIHFKNCKL